MPFYESMMILRGSMHVSDLMPSIKRASRKLVESGGIIRTIDNLGVRPLPHRIVKEREYERFGVYLRFRTSCTPEEVKEFEVVSRTDPKVLRVMTRTITERDVLKEYMYYYPKSELGKAGADRTKDPTLEQIESS